MIKQIKQEVKKILSGSGVDIEIKLEFPPGPDKGDLAFPCFEYAQKHGENPAEVAKQLAELADGYHGVGMFEDVEAVGPYVNFFLNISDVTDDLIPMVLDLKEGYGFEQVEETKHILLEYPSPNTHKRFHVGHLRNVCIGNAMRELYEKTGHKVHAVNYVNDFGVHVAKSLWGIINLHDGEIPDDNLQEWLGEVYKQASSQIEEDEAKKQEVEEILQKLTNKDEEIYDLFEQTRDASLEVYSDIFQELGVEHERTYFESNIRDRGQKIVDELLEKDIAQEGEGGAIIVDLEDYGLKTALLRKSNGEGLYLTSDLALAEKKHNDYPKVDRSIYITGNEQEFHFRQLFKILELYGFSEEQSHIGYGLVNLPEGKMSSREGNVVLFAELKEKLFQKLKQETKNRHEDWSKERVERKAEKMTTAVAKFELQKHEAQKNVTFDLEQATNFEGYSAPYVLYVVARINSLEEKADVDLEEINYELFTKPEERRLIMKVAKFESIIDRSLGDYNTSDITRYCFDLAQEFNNYYANHSIINENNEELTTARLALAIVVRQTLKNALSVLTIDTLEEM
ncbi:MAG: arginine--tRNA ligase [Candidatus Paceibacteria bacterium]